MAMSDHTMKAFDADPKSAKALHGLALAEVHAQLVFGVAEVDARLAAFGHRDLRVDFDLDELLGLDAHAHVSPLGRAPGL